jgi:hypothetical protein
LGVTGSGKVVILCFLCLLIDWEIVVGSAELTFGRVIRFSGRKINAVLRNLRLICCFVRSKRTS